MCIKTNCEKSKGHHIAPTQYKSITQDPPDKNSYI